MKRLSVYTVALLVAVLASYSAVSMASYKPNSPTAASGMYEWRTVYLPHYAESYTHSSKPVLAFAHGKEDYEEQYRLCAVVEGDGALMLIYGEEGDAVEFHLETPGDICVTTFVGWGGGGRHLNQLDVYLYYYDKGTPPTLYRPEIKAGITNSAKKP
jgi:hypothetical protein